MTLDHVINGLTDVQKRALLTLADLERKGLVSFSPEKPEDQGGNKVFYRYRFQSAPVGLLAALVNEVQQEQSYTYAGYTLDPISMDQFSFLRELERCGLISVSLRNAPVVAPRRLSILEAPSGAVVLFGPACYEGQTVSDSERQSDEGRFAVPQHIRPCSKENVGEIAGRYSEDGRLVAEYYVQFDARGLLQVRDLCSLTTEGWQAVLALQDPAKADETVQAPAYKRLVLRKGGSGDNQAELDGREYRINDTEFEFLDYLQKAAQAAEEKVISPYVSAKALEGFCGRRPDKVCKGLPPSLRRIIERPSRCGKRKGTGYRML